MTKASPAQQQADDAAPLIQVAPAKPGWPTSVMEDKPLPRYQMPADFESRASLQFQATDSNSSHEFWLFQLPQEFDPEAGLEWQLTNEKDGSVSGTCQNSEGQTYAFEEQPVGMYGQAFTISKAEPKSETLTLTQCRRHVTVFKSYQLPDRIAAAKAMGAVMPSAEMPGISGIISTQSAEEGAIPPVQPPDESLIQKQQEQVKRHSAHDQLFVTPKDSKQQRKQAKSETKKLAKRAQEHTAVNEEHRKLQRVADVPLIAPDMLQVTAEPEVISQATLKQQGTWKPSPSSKNNLAPLKEEYKPVKDQDEDGKTKRVKKRDGNVTVTTTIDLSGLSD